MSTNTFDLKNLINPIIPGTLATPGVDTGMSSSLKINAIISKVNTMKEGAEPNLVISVAGKRGDVTLNKNDVGLNNIDNTSDANKPVSNAVNTALNLKLDKSTWNDLLEVSSKLIIKKTTNISGELFINNVKVDPNKKVESLNDIVDVSTVLPSNG